MPTRTIHEEPSVQRGRRLRHRREVDRLDYLRTVRALASSMRQEDLAKHLGVTQPAISATLRKAARYRICRLGSRGRARTRSPSGKRLARSTATS